MVSGCSRPASRDASTAKYAAGARSAPAKPQFANVTQESGIDFVHRHCGTGHRYYPETMCGGAVLFDCDGDDDLDLYVVQGAPTPGYDGPDPGGNVLYRNDGTGHFAKVADSGAEDPGYGIAAVAADYDNDGDQDLYVCNFGPNALLRNNGEGTFDDVTQEAGVGGGEAFTSDSAFGDYDLDGHLDLYLANYVAYRWGYEDKVRRPDDPILYFSPQRFSGCADRLYRNNGDGTFSDVTKEAGVYDERGKGMDVTFLDFNDDGRPDIAVTNDLVPGFLYKNKGDGTFVEVGVESGFAFNDEGRAVSGMSVDTCDYDHDGRRDLLISSYEHEACLLLRNLGDERLSDATFAAGLGASTLPYVQFGAHFLDYDLDGWCDLYVANGHTFAEPRDVSYSGSHAQPDQLFGNAGDGTFMDVSEGAGGWFDEAWVGRGVTTGDLDGDGDIDLYVANNNQRGALVRNDTPHGNHWLRLKLVGTKSNRDAVGARVTVRAGDLVQDDELTNGAGILAASDRRLTFGLGRAPQADEVRIRWPSGAETVLRDLPADRQHTLTEAGDL